MKNENEIKNNVLKSKTYTIMGFDTLYINHDRIDDNYFPIYKIDKRNFPVFPNSSDRDYEKKIKEMHAQHYTEPINKNGNMFFAMGTRNNNGIGPKDPKKCETPHDFILDEDFHNYKTKTYFFKTPDLNMINFYVFDRTNYLYPVELKTNFHREINYNLSNGELGTGSGIFIVTERKIGNPDFINRKNNYNFNLNVWNVSDRQQYQYLDGMYRRTTNIDMRDYYYRTSVNDAKLRSWDTVIGFYSNIYNKRQLSTKYPEKDIDVVRKVHSLFTPVIPGNRYHPDENIVVSYSNQSENTITFQTMKFIPKELIDTVYYDAETDYFFVNEGSYSPEACHPFSPYGLLKAKKNEENKHSAKKKSIECVIYSKKYYNSYTSFYYKSFGTVDEVLVQPEDINGKTDFIKVTKIDTTKNLVTETDYELTNEKLTELGIYFYREQAETGNNLKETVELEKYKAEILKLDSQKKERAYEFYTKIVKEAEATRREEIKLRLELQKLELEITEKRSKVEIEKAKSIRENIATQLNTVSSLSKLFDTVEYVTGKYFFNFN